MQGLNSIWPFFIFEIIFITYFEMFFLLDHIDHSFFFETGSYYAAHAGLKLAMCIPDWPQS